MSQYADMLVRLAVAIEARGTTNHNEVFTLNIAQREWIATALRHEAARLDETKNQAKAEPEQR
jgi:hypothetical protein